MTCTGPGCSAAAVAKGLCPTHYRQRLRGRALTPVRSRPAEPLVEFSVRLPPRVIAALGPDPRGRAREIIERATQKGSKRT